MTSITMKRKKLPPTGWDNPGLFFDKGFQEWKIDSGKRGEDIASHIKAVCDVPVSQIYRDAYRRWIRETSDKASFTRWFGQLDGTRMFIGLGMAHVLETQVCRHPVYGIPYIPGSALKGLARTKAREYAEGQEDQKQFNKVIDILFGTGTDDQKADAGYLIFHDAWWVPGGEEGGSENKPYAPEIVTVHAVEYYKNQGKKPAPHPDMESPNPNQQLAVQGSFCFVIEGVSQWAQLGMKFLTIALQDEGIGGKVAAGYGYFEKDDKAGNAADKMNMPPEEKIKITIDDWGVDKIPRKFGRYYNNTMKKFCEDYGNTACTIVFEHLWSTYGNEINSWKDKPRNTAEKKAYNKLSREENAACPLYPDNKCRISRMDYILTS